MIPSWVWTIPIVVVGCIIALWMGSYLSNTGMDPVLVLLLVFFAAFCAVCAINNNFPFLLAFGATIPFFPHIGASSMPTITYFMAWIAFILFFRLCMQGYLSYRQSFSWPVLLCFAWVPIRFLMNPVTKLGATAGGTGVSGALPYFNYVLAAFTMLFLGAVLNDRAKVTYFLRWSYVICFLSGIALTICAFTPATGPYLVAMGSYYAGDIGDGIQRLVQLPGYGLYLVLASLCPTLFRLKTWHCAITFLLGFAMIIIGGNRSALAAVIVAVPVILLLRRQGGAMLLSIGIATVAILGLRATTASMTRGEIPPLLRCFGIFDSKIDKASGGDVSAEWRYTLWENAWKKVMERPLVGWGFGNLPQHVQPVPGQRTTDFEIALAGGEAHNGFVTAAYAFGIPFLVALSIACLYFIGKEFVLAVNTDRHDPELLDLHAFLAGTFAYYPVLIYTAFDLSSIGMWLYVALSCIVSHLPRQTSEQLRDAGAALRKYGEEQRPERYYNYPRQPR